MHLCHSSHTPRHSSILTLAGLLQGPPSSILQDRRGGQLRCIPCSKLRMASDKASWDGTTRNFHNTAWCAHERGEQASDPESCQLERGE